MATQSITDIIVEAQKQCAQKETRLVDMRQSVTPELFKELFLIRAKQVMLDHKAISEFIIDKHNKEVLNLMYRYTMRMDIEQINPLAGIVLNGAFGSGKSVMMSAFCKVLNDLNYSDRDRITEIHAIELAENIKIKGVAPYARIPLLIQDLGKEPNVVNDFGTIINPISSLLAVRCEYGSLTFGTTNMSAQSFEEQYKKYIRERIIEHVNLVLLPGASRRPDYSINQPQK